MVPPSFTPDSRLPPHQQHRKQMHFLYTDGICLFIARHVNVCQSVAAYLLLTACIHPSGISPPDARYAVMCSVRSSEMYSPYAGSCASHQPAAFCFPRISLLVLFQAFFLYLLPILLYHPRFCQGLFRIRSASASIHAAAPSRLRIPGLSSQEYRARLPAYKIPARPAEAFPQ